MKNKLRLLIPFVFIASSAFAQVTKKAQVGQQADLTQYVDQRIGTGFHGHVFVGANVPFGAVQMGPTQLSKG